MFHGAELYSMAILFSEAGLLEGSYLLGSDCRDDAIERAKLGLYDASTAEPRPVPRCETSISSRAGKSGTPMAGRSRASAGRSTGRSPTCWPAWSTGRGTSFYGGTRRSTSSPSRGNDLAKLASVLAPRGLLIAGKADRPPGDAGLTTPRGASIGSHPPPPPRSAHDYLEPKSAPGSAGGLAGHRGDRRHGLRGHATTDRSEPRVSHSHEVIEGLEHILSLLKDAETGERGFVLTGEDRYLRAV